MLAGREQARHCAKLHCQVMVTDCSKLHGRDHGCFSIFFKFVFFPVSEYPVADPGPIPAALLY